MKSRKFFLIVLIALVVIAAVWSTLWIISPGQQTLDARVQRVASQLKCLICQGESVADSPSALAQQMRTAIRQQLQSGRSEQDVIRYFEQHYGDEILWSPPWQGFSLLAWLVPIAFLLSGIGLIILLLREWYSNATNITRTGLAPATNTGGMGLIPVREGENSADQTDHNEPSTRIGTSPVPMVMASLDDDLERYRAQLEAELAADDVLFRKNLYPNHLSTKGNKT